jgi:hypothetical protein
MATQPDHHPQAAAADRLAKAGTPAVFARHAGRGRWEYAPHLRLIDNELVRALDGNLRLIIEMPPRSGKTELVSRALPAWLLGVRPSWQVILASYESDFAAEHGAKARDLLAEFGPSLFGVRVNTASNARDRWDILGTPGAMRTAGIGGAITGKGAHVAIVDDPVKGAEQADSATMREKVWRWWQANLVTRLEPNGSLIVIMTC